MGDFFFDNKEQNGLIFGASATMQAKDKAEARAKLAELKGIIATLKTKCIDSDSILSSSSLPAAMELIDVRNEQMIKKPLMPSEILPGNADNLIGPRVPPVLNDDVMQASQVATKGGSSPSEDEEE